MKEISLAYPGNSYHFDKNDKELYAAWEAHIQLVESIYFRFLDGDALFVKIPSGKYAGSIAQLHAVWMGPRLGIKSTFHKGQVYANCHLYGRLTWPGRKNNIEFPISFTDMVLLEGYEGNGKYVKLDEKVLREEALKTSVLLDINSSELKVGDKVYYVNMRYGSGACLSSGTILRFEAKVSGTRTSINTIIKNDQRDEESKISDTASMVVKK